MKQLTFAFLLTLMLGAFCSCERVNGFEELEDITLDLTQLSDTVAFDSLGAWVGTYAGEISPIQIQEFSFMHYGTPDSYGYPVWEGFTLCNSQRTTYTDYATDQWNITAGGGMAGKGSPYILCYYSGWTVHNDILFHKPSSPLGIAFCQTAWALECIQKGCNNARKFGQGDYFAIIITGLDAEGNPIPDRQICYYLADYRSSNPDEWTLNTDWEECALTALGQVSGLRFTMESTDQSTYDGGQTYYSNTTTYFALDRLTIAITE